MHIPIEASLSSAIWPGAPFVPALLAETNSPGQSVVNIYQVCLAATVVFWAWFALDMRHILKLGQRKNQLSIEGRWKDLEEHYKRASRTLRPFVWLYRRLLLPGTVPAQYALFLHTQGRPDEALVKVDEALRLIEGKPRILQPIYRSATFKILCSCLRARILILTGMGRYDEARETAAQLQRRTGPVGRPNAALFQVEYYCGHLDEALALAEAVPIEDSHYDAARGIVALAHSMKGEFDQAVQALSYEPSDISKFYSRAGLEIMKGSSVSSKLLELQRKKHAGVFQPARLLFLANIYLAREDFENADRMLDQAEKLLGPQPGVQSSYCRYRAHSAAAQGKTAEAERYIERLRTLVQQLPKRSLLREAHYSTGRSYMYLKRFSDALAEFEAAERFGLHPVEKHITAYWLARAHEAAGTPNKAIQYYQAVVADTIPSRLRTQAAEALAQLGH